ncbi:MAG: signal peptidase I [Candidatus Magasanikbacteria bacterium]
MEFIIFLILFVLAFTFFLFAGLLFLVSKLFKIENLTYKKSFVIHLIVALVNAFLLAIFYVIGLGFSYSILISVVTFFVFHYFYKKYYLCNWKKSLSIYVVFILFNIISTIIIVSFIRFYVFTPFLVNGVSMSPTYNSGDYLLVDKINQDFAREDIVVFKSKAEQGAFHIKRIIGLPGEKVEIKDNKVMINGQILNESYVEGDTVGDVSIQLEQDQYFVLGDNRSESFDSRKFGFVKKSNIQGEIFYKISGLIK